MNTLDLVKKNMEMKDTITMKIELLHREFFKYAEEQLLEKTGLSWGSVPFILYIGKHPGCTHSDLTKSLHIDWGYSHRAIVKLEKGGYIIREIDRGNGNRLYLQERGKKAFRISHDAFSSFDEMITSKLGDEDVALLNGILDKLK